MPEIMPEIIPEIKSIAEYQYYKRLRELLHVVDVVDDIERYIRIGQENEGGYLMLAPHGGNKIAYSIGLKKGISWDQDMVDLGYHIYMYDPAINRLHLNNRRFHRFRIGIEAVPSKDKKHLTLQEMILQNHHEKERRMILKMDLEGREWQVFANINPAVLEQFDQIILELYGLFENEENDIIKALENLNKTHRLIHIHVKNYNQKPSSIEATFASKEIFLFKENHDQLWKIPSKI